MYTIFYGLKEKPFNLTPDPRFLYFSESHKEALARLKYGIQERKGFAALTGEVGTGKTTLVNSLIRRLNGNVKPVLVTNPNMTVSDFFHYVGSELGFHNFNTKGNFLVRFKEYIQHASLKNQTLLIIIDEAQNLSFELLEEIRLLSNFETPSEKLLQIFLVGQQELNDKLNLVHLRQLKQRIGIKFHIQPLGFDDTQRYIQKRLFLAGLTGTRNKELFTKKAIKKIYHYSKGVPRLINIICDHALLSGYVKEKRHIDHSIIQDVIKEIEASYPSSQMNHMKQRHYGSFILFLVLLAAMVFGILGWFYIMGFFRV